MLFFRGGKSYESINLVQKMKVAKIHKKNAFKREKNYRNIKHLLISFKSSKVLVELEGDPVFGWGSDLISRMCCEGFSLNSGDLELGVVFPNSESGLPFVCSRMPFCCFLAAFFTRNPIFCSRVSFLFLLLFWWPASTCQQNILGSHKTIFRSQLRFLDSQKMNETYYFSLNM